jgi:hypothetical protein
MNKHPDDEQFTDDELREMEAALHLIHAQRHVHDAAVDHDEDETDDDVKATKKEAHYRPGTLQRHCEICTMFEHGDNKHGTGTCTSVEGEISPNALCDYFKRQNERAVGGAADHVHYEKVPIKGAVPHGGFRLPLDVLNRLSREHGPREIGVMLKKLFDVDPDNPQNIPAHAVAAHGGHKVLERFVRNLRSGRAQSQTIPQPDRHHGRVR